MLTVNVYELRSATPTTEDPVWKLVENPPTDTAIGVWAG